MVQTTNVIHRIDELLKMLPVPSGAIQLLHFLIRQKLCSVTCPESNDKMKS